MYIPPTLNKGMAKFTQVDVGHMTLARIALYSDNLPRPLTR